jgi:hypothetical protein
VGVDDRVAQFVVSIGTLCADAHVAQLPVRLSLATGDCVAGVPEAPQPTEGPEQVDDTGFADAITIEGVAVQLSDVVEASIRRPGAELNDGPMHDQRGGRATRSDGSAMPR